MEAWHRFWSLRADSRRLILEAAAALAATWVGLRVLGFRRWKSIFAWFASRRVGRARAAESAALGAAGAIARLADGAARHLFFRTNCLERSLVLCWLLERRGIGSQLRLGGRKEGGRFEAHAWVEVGGSVVNDVHEPHLHFAPFGKALTSLG